MAQTPHFDFSRLPRHPTMPATMTKPHGERRSIAVHIHESQIFNLGFKRLEELMDQQQTEHDLVFRDYDPEKYQVLYSLRRHNARVGEVAHLVASRLGWSQHDTNIARLAGIWHDLGKLDPTCWKYRSIDIFSDEERREFTLRHQMVSRRFVMNLKPLVRVEDRPILTEVGMVVRHHHDDPHEITLGTIRIKCLLIRMSDIFVTVQEDRKYQLGKSEWQAVKIVREVVEDWRTDPRFTPHIKDAETISNAIASLYGPENIGLTDKSA